MLYVARNDEYLVNYLKDKIGNSNVFSILDNDKIKDKSLICLDTDRKQLYWSNAFDVDPGLTIKFLSSKDFVDCVFSELSSEISTMMKVDNEFKKDVQDKVFKDKLSFYLNEVKDILIKKNFDYGSDNLFYYGEFGLLVRMRDKLNRIENFVLKEEDLKNESYKDSLMDLIGYSLLWLIYFSEE